MFTYFEGYHPRVWEGLVKNGFVRKNTGLRFCQNVMLPEELKFNNLARIGGEFYNIQKELDCPMYIDRLQGGCYIDDYPYEEALLEDYRSRLGSKYWGFQMHEWMSNLRSDVSKVLDNGGTDWTAKGIAETILRVYPGKYLFLESMLAEELEAFPKPEGSQDIRRMAMWMYRDRIRRYKELVPCDSAFLAYKLEIENAVTPQHRFMPEVGAQTRDSRLQICYALGMAKAYGCEFGVYYEPWGGDPFSACCYNVCPEDNEWALGLEAGFPFKTDGPNGGSSRSLQKRIHLYSYFSGASFMSEEWGMCNTFTGWQDFEVSPYGTVKKQFLDLTEKYPDPGVKLTPAAVVLPREMDVLDPIYQPDQLFGFPLTGEEAYPVNKIKLALARIFAVTDPMVGTETVNLRNNAIPDGVDLIHSDAKTIGQYPYLVDLSGGQIPAQFHERIIPEEELAARVAQALPCTVTGSCHWMVTRRENGRYFLVVFNHSGVERTVKDGERLIPEAKTSVRICVKDDRKLTALEGSREIALHNGIYHLSVAPGDWFLAEF